MLMDIIKSRHSIRKYTDRQISREDLEKILEGRQLCTECRRRTEEHDGSGP